MEIKDLTKAEEQLMQVLWQLESAFVKEVIDQLPEPKPAYNTVSTIIRILEVKGFIAHEAFGKAHKYHPIISKEEYKRHATEKLLGNYFENSVESMFSFFVKEEKLDLSDVDEILKMINKFKKQTKMSWSHYLLQVNIYLVVFYAFYRLLLAKETYFTLNRIYLICAGIFSLTIPFMQIDWFGKQEISKQMYLQVEQLNQFIVQTSTETTAQYFNWGTLIVVAYLLGVAFFLTRLAVQLLAIKKMLRGIKSGLAFSFWNKKVVAQHLPEVATVNHHEDIHIKQFHTFDVIFFELLGILTWFNPIIYLYKETVKNIHEYLADEAAAEFQGDKEAYSMLLLNQAFGVNANSLTNGFFKKSMIKNRIFMLYKERSRKTAIIKYGIVVPLFAAALLLSSATIKKNEQILAVAEQVPLEQVTAVVSETLNLPKEHEVNVKVTETSVKFDKSNNKNSNNEIEQFYRHLGNNIKYPSTAADNSIQGNLIVNFTVDNEALRNITIEPKLGYGTDEEVSVVLAKYKNTVLSNGKYSMRIEYRLSGAYTPVLNENAMVKKGYTNLNTIVIMGYGKKVEENEEDKVHGFVSIKTPPTYPGGMSKFYEYIGENLKYPEDAKKNDIQGKVFMSFTVEKDGSINDVRVDRKLGYGTDEEAVRVIQSSKKWNPGISKGKPVRVRYNMPIQFKLTDDSKTQRIVPSERVNTDSFIKGMEYPSGKEPLMILNGDVYKGKLEELNQKNIEAVHVLKDAKSIALYGEKGRNGVIIITTKKEPKIPTLKPIKN